MSEVKDIELLTPHAKQAEIINSPARFKVAVCGRRFGKTVLTVDRLIEEALLNAGTNYFYIAPTYKQGKMIAWDMLMSQLRELPSELVQKTNESELYVVLGNNAKIYIKGADKPDSLRGVGLGGVVLDEYADMKQNVFDEIIRPTLVDTGGWAIFIGTPRGFNHFYDLYMEAQTQEDWAAFRFPTTANPFISKEEIEKERNRMHPDRFAQEYMAQFRKREGLVYPEFQREVHVVDEKHDRGTIIDKMAGLDFGYTNPSAFVVIHKNEMGQYFIEEEWVRTGKKNSEIGEYVRTYVDSQDVNYIYPDPAEPDRIDELNDMGIPTREVIKKVGAGIDKVRDLLHSKKLFISANCKTTIQEFETYHYPENQDSKLNKSAYEKPVKEDDHCMDAVRYALSMNAPASNSSESNDVDFNLYGRDYN